MIRALSTWLVLGLAGAGLICGCGSSSTSTTTVAAAGAAEATGPAGAAVPATGPAGAAVPATGPASVAGAKGSASASGSQAAAAAAIEASASSSSGSVWNTVQCGTAVLNYVRSSKPTPAGLRSYKRTLSEQHGCYTAASRSPLPPASAVAKAWNTIECAAAVIKYVRSSKPTAAGLRAYKRTLLEQHGCYTAASLTPPGPPVKPKRHG